MISIELSEDVGIEFIGEYEVIEYLLLYVKCSDIVLLRRWEWQIH